MKLYFHPASPFARKPRIAAALLGIDLETQMVDIFAGQNQTPEYLRLNPQGKVPTLVDGDFSLWESNAIVQYLATKTPESALCPKDDRTRADILRWQFWESTSWAPACAIFVYENVLKSIMGRGEADPEQLKQGGEKLQRCAKLLNDHLSTRQWLVGEALSLADISVAPMLMYADSARYPLDGFDHITAWFGRIQQLPAWDATSPAS